MAPEGGNVNISITRPGGQVSGTTPVMTPDPVSPPEPASPPTPLLSPAPVNEEAIQ